MKNFNFNKVFFVFVIILLSINTYLTAVTVTETSDSDFGDGYSVQTDTLTVLGSIQLSTTASPSWYNNDWTYRKAITVTNPNTHAIVNFQIWVPTGTSSGQVDLDTAVNFGKMQSNQGDVRFTSSNGTTLLNYWIQPSTITATLGKTLGFWVKVSSIAKNSGTDIIYMYYGNASTGTTSNFDNTMEKLSTSTAANVYDTRLRALYNLDNSQIESELIPDGGFEQWTSATNLTNWDENNANGTTRKIDQVTNPRKGGSNSVKISAVGNDGTTDIYLSTGIQVQSNRCYQINYWLEYVTRTQGKMHVGMWQGGAVISSSTIDSRFISMTTGYYTLRATATATGWAEIRIVMSRETNAVAYIDDISVRYSTPMFTDASSYGINGHFVMGSSDNQLHGAPSFNGYDGGRCGDISTDTVRFATGDSVSGLATNMCFLNADTNVSNLNLDSAITLEAWGTMRSSVPAGDYSSLWAVKEGGWGIYPVNTSGADFGIDGKIRTANGGGAGISGYLYFNAGGNYKASVNQWYHIVMTYSQATGKLIGYVNGQKFSEVDSLGGIIDDTHDAVLKIGHTLSGMVDGVAIYNVAISSREVTAHYWRHRYAELTPTCSIGSEQPKYYSGGSYSSSVIFTGVDSSSMTLVWFSSTAVSGGQINLQVRASDTQFYEADGTPSWVDVNGSSDTMITAIGKYMQYRSTFSTVYSTVTAVLNDVTIEYSTVTVPSAPTGLYATDVTSGSVTWNWTDTNSAGNSKQEEGYKIYSSTGGSYTGLTALDITSKNEINLSSNTLYSRYVQAYNSAGSSNSVVVSTYTLASPPNNLILNILYRSSATISWDDVGATQYSVERAVGPSSPGTWSVINSTPLVGYTYTGLLGETTYWFRVKSYNNSGVLTATASNIVSTVTVPLPPTGFTASQISTSSIMWSWKDNSNFDNGYRVYASTDGILKTLSANVTYWTETNKMSNTLHSRYVVAYNASESNYSNVISSYTLANSPTNLVMNTLYRSSATISWDNVGATRYLIERSLGVSSPDSWQTLNSTPTPGYTDTGLSGETTYWYRVKSYNADDLINETASNIISTITVTAAPTGFKASQISTGSIMWSWEDNSNAEIGYRVYATTDGIIKTLSTAGATYWLETNMQPNTQYSRYAVAYNASESDISNVISSYTLANSPTNLVMNTLYRSSATISWDNVGATRYAIERSTGDVTAVNWQYIIQWADNIIATNYTDTLLSSETTYWYRVKSYNTEGIMNITSSNIISTITVPSAVSGFTCNLVSTSSIMWSWSDNSNIEDGYYIKTSTSGIIKTFVSETTYWQETGLQPNTQYSRYAVAYNANESEASTTISTYTLATSPISLTASVINMSSATLSWSGNGTRYAIERSANGTSWSYIKQWADAVTDTIYTDTGLTVNATYYYRIRAYNGDGIITDSSSVVTIKTLKKEQKPAVPGSIVIYLINGQTSAVPGDTIRLTATAEAGSSIYSMIVKDQNGNILSQWIEPAGEVAQPPISLLNVEISDSGEIIANILLGDIASKYPMVNGIKVEVTVEDQYDNISEPGSSNLINVSFGENKITLYNNLFNPKTNVTTLRYDLIQSGNVKIDVYTLNGEKVKTLINENKDTGVYWATWDGKDTDGDYVASGIYLVHIKGPDSYSETKKVCVIK